MAFSKFSWRTSSVILSRTLNMPSGEFYYHVSFTVYHVDMCATAKLLPRLTLSML